MPEAARDILQTDAIKVVQANKQAVKRTLMEDGMSEGNGKKAASKVAMLPRPFPPPDTIKDGLTSVLAKLIEVEARAALLQARLA